MRVWPVTKEASLLARNWAAAAISAGVPTRFSTEGGSCHVPSVVPEGGAPASRSVAIQPGLIPFTRTP